MRGDEENIKRLIVYDRKERTYLQAGTEASPPCLSEDPTVPLTVRFDWSPATKPKHTTKNKQTNKQWRKQCS